MAIPDRLNNVKFYRDFVLNDDERSVYDTLLLSIQRNRPSVVFYNTLEQEQYQKIVYGVVLDNPNIISHCLYKLSEDGTSHDVSDLQFFRLEKRTNKELKIIDNIVETLKEETKNMNDYDKAFHIFKYLATTVEYDLDAYRMVRENSARLNNRLRVFDMTGALIDKKAVCQGISLAYEYLLYMCGIDSYIQSCRYSGVGHCFNIVKLNIDGVDRYINADLTMSMIRKDAFYYYHGSKRKHSFNKWGFAVSSAILKELGYEFQYVDLHEDDGSLSYFAKNDLIFTQFPKIRRYIKRKANRHECVSFIYQGSFTEETMRSRLHTLSREHRFGCTEIYTLAPFYLICGGQLYE